MLIKDFLNTHTHCLKCNGELHSYCISTASRNEKYIAKVRDGKFVIQIKTDYYLEHNQGVVKCIFDIDSNLITKSRSMNIYVKLYPIDLYIIRKCFNCSSHPKILDGFFYCGRFKYNTMISDFSLDLANDGFTHSIDQVVYGFANSYEKNKGVLIKQYIDNSLPQLTVDTFIIPLNKFPFNNPSKIKNKLDNITLLM